ncbi:radical SAM/SPASM domain-containing protein [Natronoflexus pectinivorans]|uniref:Radical SAM protein with 4Fe4S-binding SPASM domain n=1 Tax=Natronoflexus pectinivorans TaxID=682526 RepID=A0A4R2GI85_9BACT|nr:radical SAM/SPASM domain-containing protein [Natronoflexus pectinivorans]TCO08260.1 radical SAM protein with 4Fe4S-binding SPASM domain [Natronoflexus pectinivorans]
MVKGKPWTISVEPSGQCNLQCPECPVGAAVLNRKGGFMTTELFQKTVQQAGESLFYINFFFQGEPTLNPHLSEMIKIATQNRIYSNMSTNGHLLTPERSRTLVQSGLSRVIVSIDGLTDETYAMYRRGGSLSKAEAGIRNLLVARKSLKSKTPFVTVQFLVFRHNEHEIPLLKNWVKKINADQLEIKTAQFNDYGDGSIKPPVNSKYSRYTLADDDSLQHKGRMYNHCFKQWGGMVVSWDGQSAPCCYDKNLDYSAGNIKNVSFNGIWDSDKMNDFRKQIMTSRKAIDMCRNCPEGRNSLL